ncbi:uncharacterized protein [Lepeophtheirus salmonis]|uniref:uncharacterized protein n=1 Tax=Lepeophtheirus salmonis TaxID=72036 RepID=UPI001AE55743|nr:uncharacterized protein LOC121120392 [Lepeophtheirus salmonis]
MILLRVYPLPFVYLIVTLLISNLIKAQVEFGEEEEEFEAIRVVGSSPPDGTIVKRGYDIRLSCRTSIKWFFCLWKSPDGNKQCAIQESSPRSVCSPDKRVVLQGGANFCELHLKNSSAIDDYGSWMCTVSDAETFESVKHYINLEIAVPAIVEFDPTFGEDRVLTITENEQQSINCKASKAHPTPILTWEGDESLSLDTNADPLIFRDEATHSSEVQHTSVYKAKLEDNNRIITCVATQLDHDGRTVLYETSATLKLNVEKIILPVDYALHQRIGIISGVLLSIIFILLLIVCLIIFLCRKRRRRDTPNNKRSRASSSQLSIATSGDLSPPSLKPIWTVKQGDRYKRDEQLIMAKKYEIKISPTNIRRPDSQVTYSTMGSREGSWIEIEEENRSIGSGSIIHTQPTGSAPISSSPILSTSSPSGPPPPPRETHFDESIEEDDFSFDLPRPVIFQQPAGTSQNYQNPFHPTPQTTTSQTPLSYLTSWRPNSATNNTTTSEPYYHFGYGSQAALTYTRPSSALSYPNSVADPTKPIELFYYNFPAPKRLPTPNGMINTSGVSVFECDLGCFKIPPESSSTHQLEEAKEEPEFDFNDIITRNQSKDSSEEDPRDV